jgi:conjugal transfer pilus assembly protein TraK
VKKTDDKPFDPLAVHSDVSVKDAQQKEILLPGVMKIAGANADALDFSKSRVVDVSNNGSETVYLSYDYPNRIQIPWVNPKIVGADQLTIDKTPVSNNIYIHFKDGVTEPVQVYFDHVDGIGDVLGLQLIPKHIPAQTIIVRDTSRLNGESIKAPKGNDYVTQTQALIETVELGGTPQGFSKIDLKLPPIVMNGLTINTDKQFSSTDRDVFVYTVENPAKTVATLTEKEFDGANVLAVSIFPKPILRVGERAMVVVVARKVKGDDHGQ